jgi:hypothetical protein
VKPEVTTRVCGILDFRYVITRFNLISTPFLPQGRRYFHKMSLSQVERHTLDEEEEEEAEEDYFI